MNFLMGIGVLWNKRAYTLLVSSCDAELELLVCNVSSQISTIPKPLLMTTIRIVFEVRSKSCASGFGRAHKAYPGSGLVWSPNRSKTQSFGNQRRTSDPMTVMLFSGRGTQQQYGEAAGY
ncbi:hypothetical protein B0H10DRAFT_1946251 [Mycena sp. CBHHK59/15]|nr:hypothetical protein B0H10DRAFT_1946251 [Mycena sp. CBHHK59/15]